MWVDVNNFNRVWNVTREIKTWGHGVVVVKIGHLKEWHLTQFEEEKCGHQIVTKRVKLISKEESES